jgi:DNA replication protein DnaC
LIFQNGCCTPIFGDVFKKIKELFWQYRHGKRTTIITSQVPVKKSHEIIGEKTLADAILDRIVHQSIRIEMY